MKLGITLSTFNRPAYLKECLDSLRRADIPTGTEIVIVDDCSTDAEASRLINESNHTVIRKSANKGIKDSLLIGINHLAHLGCNVFMNLDSDAVVRNDFIEKILEVHCLFLHDIVTGFNCLTKNRDGSDRHKIIEEGSVSEATTANFGPLSVYTGESVNKIKYNRKRSVGGLNMCFGFGAYEKHIKPALLISGNWDHNACISAGSAVCTVPSVVQHIGVNSSMGHHEQPDIADDFKGLVLPNVTLICVDDNMERARQALMKCANDIDFQSVQLIQPNPALGSKRAYSEYIMHQIHTHVNTSHMLIVQHDGYVKNWKAWNKDWLKYDYIGAPWLWYADNMQVGNGGFSLRSKRLMELCSTLPLKTDRFDNNNHAEDHSICRIYRRHLESKGMKFAPVEEARKFSIEGYRSDPVYRGQFGFHSSHVIFR